MKLLGKSRVSSTSPGEFMQEILTGHIKKTTIVISQNMVWRTTMLKASVSELKASASEYLKLVKGGEEVLLTDRGNPIAKIIPLRTSELAADLRIAQLELAGLAKVGKGKLPLDFWSIPRHLDKKGAVLAALLAEREDGR
jgi:prevent-host-death family protein